MEENQNSDFNGKSNSTENSNRQGGSNYHHGPSNSNSGPSPSNSNSIPGPSNANPRQVSSNSLPRTSTSSNHWQERDPKPPKKRSHSENDDWGREKLNKSEANSDNEGTERVSKNSNDNQLMTLDEITAASVQKAVTCMSQQNQQPITVGTPQPPQQTHQPKAINMPQQSQQQTTHPQVMRYLSYDYNVTENDPYIDPIQGGSALNPMMSMNSQWPVNYTVPTVANNVASTSGIGMPMEMVSPSMGAFPHMNISNNDPSSWNRMMPGFPLYPLANNQDAIIPMFNNLEPLIFTRAVLTPTLPGVKCTRRPKPNRCRTVFVGNLPEKVTEEIIREAFEICGPISVIRMSRKNFCHIRFVDTESVDQALFLSGFRIRIDESEDPAFNGRLHVDYAIAREDQHDWEPTERARLREKRRRLQESYNPPSPPLDS